MASTKPTRIVIVAPDTLVAKPGDEAAALKAERSRSLRIGLLEAGYNIVAVLPADTLQPDRLAQLQPDMIIVGAESQARDTLEHMVIATRDARRAPPDRAVHRRQRHHARARGHRRGRHGLRGGRPGVGACKTGARRGADALRARG